jgi:uncharacterized protein
LKDSAFPSKIQFSACNNTKEGMEKKEGQPITVSEAVFVPSDVVRLMELQEKDWSYVRPQTDLPTAKLGILISTILA